MSHTLHNDEEATTVVLVRLGCNNCSY